MVKAEEFKGIEYVRISNLPQKEADQITGSKLVKKITILKDETLMRDCIKYKDYKEWYENHYCPSDAINLPLASEKTNVGTNKNNYTLNIMRHFQNFMEKI